jgi:hypothetical protein
MFGNKPDEPPELVLYLAEAVAEAGSILVLNPDKVWLAV